MDLRNDLFEAMWLAMTPIEAQSELTALKRMDWAHLKKRDREKLHKEYFEKAFPGEMKPKNFVAPEQVQALLGGLNG